MSVAFKVKWAGWDVAKGDTGDEPVVGYKVFWRPVHGNEWMSHWINSTTSLFHTVSQLKPYTSYDVAVAAFRPGPGGLGSRSPVANVQTKCAGKPRSWKLLFICVR